jgi:hypothetical protein
MEYLPVFGLMFIIVAFISWRWVKAIDYMHKHHPDYKGEEFLNWDRKNDEWDKTPTHSGRDAWDDEKVHTEGDF